MSSNESDGMEARAVEKAVKRLRAAADAALGEIERLRGEISRTRKRTQELEEMLGGITSGERSPTELMMRVEELEESNTDMEDRLERGRDAVDRLLARIRFLEEQR